MFVIQFEWLAIKFKEIPFLVPFKYKLIGGQNLTDFDTILDIIFDDFYHSRLSEFRLKINSEFTKLKILEKKCDFFFATLST